MSNVKQLLEKRTGSQIGKSVKYLISRGGFVQGKTYDVYYETLKGGNMQVYTRGYDASNHTTATKVSRK